MFTNMSYIKKKIRGLSLKIFNYIENNGDWNFDNNGEKIFIENLIREFRKESGKKVIFDIGANLGEYSQMIITKTDGLDKELHLFEPTANCFKTIYSKFKNNANIKLNNFGVSDNNSLATIYYDKEKSGLASLYQRDLDSYDVKLNQSEEVNLKRIDGYIEENSIKHINLIKIDIEGHELKAFEGFGNYLNGSFIDYLQFEYGGANLDSHSSLIELYRILKKRGFIIAKIMPKGLEIRQYKPYMENYNYSNYVAISERIYN